MVLESEGALGRRNENLPGYCPTGQELIDEFGPASRQFARHVQSCDPCATALRKEGIAITREMNAAKRHRKI